MVKVDVLPPVPDLSGNVFNFSPLRMMLAVGFSYFFLLFCCKLPLCHSLESFYYASVLSFVRCFVDVLSASVEMTI